MMLGNKRGQLTIFTILGVLIVMVLIMFFVIKSNEGSEISPKKDPQGYIESCIGKEVEKILSKLYDNGLSLDPTLVTSIGSVNASVLCYTDVDNQLCPVSHPLLFREAEQDMTTILGETLPQCFDILRTQLKDSYRDLGPLNVSLEFNPGFIAVNVNKKISIDRGDSSMDLEKFPVSVKSNIYSFFMITNKILSEEVLCDCPNEYCAADLLEMGMQNPDFGIYRDTLSNGRKSYKITEKINGKETIFLIRNCVLNFNP